MPTGWRSRVICAHEAVLGTEQTAAEWISHASCARSERIGDWEVAVVVTDDAARTQILAALTAIGPDVSVAGAVAQLSRGKLPRCSVLLGDGEYAAGLAWGEPLGLADLGGWEYALATSPVGRGSWSPLAPGTIVALDSCGPVVFPIPFRQEI